MVLRVNNTKKHLFKKSENSMELEPKPFPPSFLPEQRTWLYSRLLPPWTQDSLISQFQAGGFLPIEAGLQHFWGSSRSLPWVYVDNPGSPRALPVAQEIVLPWQDRQTERSPLTALSQLLGVRMSFRSYHSSPPNFRALAQRFCLGAGERPLNKQTNKNKPPANLFPQEFILFATVKFKLKNSSQK